MREEETNGKGMGGKLPRSGLVQRSISNASSMVVVSLYVEQWYPIVPDRFKQDNEHKATEHRKPGLCPGPL